MYRDGYRRKSIIIYGSIIGALQGERGKRDTPWARGDLYGVRIAALVISGGEACLLTGAWTGGKSGGMA